LPAAIKPVADPSVLGVGIDMEERAAFARLDGASVEHAALRWLTTEERHWCRTQDSLAEALLVVLCCKEAVFKASNQGRAPHQVRLTLAGSSSKGRGWAMQSAVPVTVLWSGWREQVVALAIATGGSADVDLRDLPKASEPV
jgi:phosphopantetheinyl transferase (holo-ACP synthase)